MKSIQAIVDNYINGNISDFKDDLFHASKKDILLIAKLYGDTLSDNDYIYNDKYIVAIEKIYNLLDE